MAKRNLHNQEKLFNLDLESLFEESQEEQNGWQASSSESCKPPKKIKNNDNKPGNKLKTTDATSKVNVGDRNDEAEKIDEFNDVSIFFENVGNDFGKSVQLRKMRLDQFTDSVISVYESKLTELIQRQENEVKELKESLLGSIQEELDKGAEELRKLKLQENKIVKAIEQQMKLFEKSTRNVEAYTQNFKKFHKNFIQAFESLKMKHRNEALEFKKSTATDMSVLQSKFLRETKKEEIETLKKYWSRIYF